MREAVVTITYAVVVFSILVQGLTINRMLGTGASIKNGTEDTVSQDTVNARMERRSGNWAHQL